ncbi:hypothetical protein E1264_22625 [Actinomadura sp. KC216]|uniref:hypothetical protein n=1 Tax=Actinomadura sp. KC216 TaxID=2530370 RepID=UPI00104A0A65|nr:hypothetical protein [Actinomadura sp. KC216]TDB85002.1 hypothetical protein E1264_22625 [Actinomadura sp. KC216]
MRDQNVNPREGGVVLVRRRLPELVRANRVLVVCTPSWTGGRMFQCAPYRSLVKAQSDAAALPAAGLTGRPDPRGEQEGGEHA